MGKVRSCVFLKTAAFIFQQIFFVVMFFSISIGITYWNYDDASFDILEQADFTRTNYYKRLVEDSIYSLITYIGYCEKFQTDGVRDTGRIVDIYDYIQNDRITGKRTISLGYSMQALLDWYQEGFYFVTGEYADYEVDLEEEETDYQLVEAYANDSGISLLSYAEVEQLDYRDVYETLEEAAEKLSNEYKEYKKQISLFKSNNTNLRYVMYNGDSRELYTNMNVSDITEGVEKVRGLENYVILNSMTADFDSNLFYSDEQLNHYLNALYLDNHYVFAVGVDTEFPVLDAFHKEELRYNTFEKWFKTLYKLLLISILGYIVCLTYLSAAAGHKRGREGITVTILENVKTEFLAAVFLGGEIYLWWQISWVMSSFLFPSFAPSSIIRLLILSSSAGLLGMICYLSLLRRIKARILWKNSLLNQVWEFGKQLFHNKHLVLKLCIGYILFIMAVVFCIILTDGSGSEMLVLLVAGSVIPGWLVIRDRMEKQRLMEGCQHIADGDLEFQIDTTKLHKENKQMGNTINQISYVLHEAVEDSIKSERLKTSLITNVSHDIKTPLTSIINYVALLKGISLENEEANRYIQILEDKSQRLQHLTEDLVEASKISSGNISLDRTMLDFVELIKQTSGEFYERFRQRNLALITGLLEEPVIISADGRRIWRILENIYSNALKYSLEHSRIYAKLEKDGETVIFSLKNVSAQPLNDVDSEELTKRFVRGDVSRSTEGSGLGLSIARDLTELHGGTLKITTDGDLFCVKIILPLPRKDEV